MRRLRVAVLAVAALLAPAAFAGNAALADVLVVIDKSTQSMSVEVNGRPRYFWDVSTGRRGYGTPTGWFRPQWMARTYFSRKYYNSPMPHSIFFYRGYAIHGTEYIHRLGGPASHGCVRLHPRHAAILYALVQRHGMSNTRIIIEDSIAQRRPRRQSQLPTEEDRDIMARASRLLLSEQIERREAVARMERLRAVDAVRRMQARSAGKPYLPNSDGLTVAIGVEVNPVPSAPERLVLDPSRSDKPAVSAPLPRKRTMPNATPARRAKSGDRPAASQLPKPRPRVEIRRQKISAQPPARTNVTLR